MSASAKSIRIAPIHFRRPTAPAPSLGRRILTWLTASGTAATPDVRRPVDRPFPFFGE